MAFDYDYFVIGGGSGGVRSARIAAKNGARVGLAEDHEMGGTCVNRGCVPKKFMVFAGLYGQAFDEARGYGWSLEGTKPVFDWVKLRDAVNAKVAQISGVYQSGLDGAGVTVHRGQARLTGRHSLEVDGKAITAEKILIATGGVPAKPSIPGGDLAILSDDLFHLDELPKRLVVVGAGYIALEFASIFNALGSDVTVVYRGDLILRGFDHDLRALLDEELQRSGVKIRYHANIRSLKQGEGGIAVDLDTGDSLEADQVLYAIGRKPRVEGLGLEAAGVAMNASGAIKVDDNYRTSVPSIYAVGDVTDRVNLTPVAIREGHWLADELFGSAGNKIDYSFVTTAVFTTPELAAVGLTEEEAIKAGFDVEVYRSRFKPMRYTLTPEPRHTLMKLVVDRKSDRVLGVHMLGEGAGEIIQGLAVAVTMGATKAQFDHTVALHPTVAEEFVTMREPSVSTLQRQAAE
jgi:glutathione reductase (NADPH)